MDDPAAFRSPARAVPAEAAEGLAELSRTWLEVAAETLPGDEALVRLLTEGLDAVVAVGWPPSESEMLTVTEQASQHAVETGSTSAARGLSKRLRRAIYEFLLSLDALSSVEQMSHTAPAHPADTGGGLASNRTAARTGDRPELIWDEPELRVLDGGASSPSADTAPPVIAPPPPLGDAGEAADDAEAEGSPAASEPAETSSEGADEAADHSMGGNGWGVRSGGRRRRGPDGGRMRGGWLSRLGSSEDDDESGDDASASIEGARHPASMETPAVPPSSVPAHVPGQHTTSDPVEVELVEVPLEPPGLELVEIPLEPLPAPAGEGPVAGPAVEPEPVTVAEVSELGDAEAADDSDLSASDADHAEPVRDRGDLGMAADLGLWPSFDTLRTAASVTDEAQAHASAGEPDGAASDAPAPEPAAAEVTPLHGADVAPAEAATEADDAPAAELAVDAAVATTDAEAEETATEVGEPALAAADAGPERPTLVVVEVAPDPAAVRDDRSRVPEIFRRDQPASPLVVPSYRAWADVLAAGGEAPVDLETPAARRSGAPSSPAAPRTAPLQRPRSTGGLAARLRNARPQTVEPGAPVGSSPAPDRGAPQLPRRTPGEASSAAWPEAGLTSADALPPFPSAPASPASPEARMAAPARPLEAPAPPRLAGDDSAWPVPAFEPSAEPMSAADAWLASGGGAQPSMPLEQRWPGGAAAAASWPRESRGEPRHSSAVPPAPVDPGSGPTPEHHPSDPADDGSWSVRRSPRQQVLQERMAQRRREDAIRAATVVFDEHAGRPRRERGPELDRLRLPEQVDGLLRKKRGGEAAALVQRAAQELGGHEVAEQALDCGDRCRALNQSRAAVNSYLAAWRADPLFETPLWRLAESCLADRETELAVGYLERVADLMRARGDDEAALGVYRKIITVAPDRGDVRALLQIAQTSGRIPD